MQYALHSDPAVMPGSVTPMFSSADLARKRLEEGMYTREYCIRSVLTDEYLWDMRCWAKPKHEYTVDEVIVQLRQWLQDEEHGVWSCNFNLYYIRRLYEMGWMSREDIASLVLRNPFVTYADEIGTWNKDFED